MKPVAGSEKPKDDVRKVNEILCNECAQSQEEYKRLKGVIEQLEREYDDSKEVDYFRRYGMLKGMIKRSILHLKLQNDDQNQSTCGKTKEESRKREEHMTGTDMRIHSLYTQLPVRLYSVSGAQITKYRIIIPPIGIYILHTYCKWPNRANGTCHYGKTRPHYDNYTFRHVVHLARQLISAPLSACYRHPRVYWAGLHSTDHH